MRVRVWLRDPVNGIVETIVDHVDRFTVDTDNKSAAIILSKDNAKFGIGTVIPADTIVFTDVIMVGDDNYTPTLYETTKFDDFYD